MSEIISDEVSLRDAKEIVKMGIKQNQSVMLVGSPGCGKDAVMSQAAKEEGVGDIAIDCTSVSPEDIRGFLIPQGKKAVFTESPFMPDVKTDGERGILRFSDLPATQSVYLQTALSPAFHSDDRRLGAYKLPEGWIPMATGNYVTDGAGANRLLEHFKDRVLIVKTSLPFPEWKEDFALRNDIHPITIGLLNFRPDLFNTFLKRNKSENGKSFATARTHTEASKVLYYAEKTHMSSSALTAALSGWVGEGVASEYMAFRKIHSELPDPMEILKGKDIIPDEPSILYALCSALVAHLKTAGMPMQKAIDRMCQYALKLDAEFGGLLIKDSYLLYRENYLKSKHWVTIAQRYF